MNAFTISTVSLAEKYIQKKESENARACPRKMLNFILNYRFLALPSKSYQKKIVLILRMEIESEIAKRMAGKDFKEKKEEIDKTISYIARFDYLDPRLAPKLGLMRPKYEYIQDIIDIYSKARIDASLATQVKKRD